LAEAFNALYKTELTKRCGPWRDVEHLEAATMAHIVWFNHKRLHPEIGDIPPAEFEANYYAHLRIANTRSNPTGDLMQNPGRFSIRFVGSAAGVFM